jgi:hypothetical protein
MIRIGRFDERHAGANRGGVSGQVEQLAAASRKRSGGLHRTDRVGKTLRRLSLLLLALTLLAVLGAAPPRARMSGAAVGGHGSRAAGRFDWRPASYRVACFTRSTFPLVLFRITSHRPSPIRPWSESDPTLPDTVTGSSLCILPNEVRAVTE